MPGFLSEWLNEESRFLYKHNLFGWVRAILPNNCMLYTWYILLQSVKQAKVNQRIADLSKKRG